MALLTTPHARDSRQHRPPIHHESRIRDRERRLRPTVKGTRVAGVQVRLRQRRVTRRTDRISRLVGDELEDVCADVPAAEGVQTPVRFHGGDLGVVRIEGGIGGALEGDGDGVAKEDGVDFVLLAVCFVFVESEEDEGIVHEVFVRQERREEAVRPGAGDGDGRVVAVVGHVGGDEHPLRELVCGEVGVELSEVLDDGEAVLALRDGVVDDERARCPLVADQTRRTCGVRGVLVFSDIVGLALRIQPLGPFVTRIWQVFLIFTPADAFFLQKVDEGGDIRGDLPEGVVVHAEIIAADRRDVVRLAWVCDGEVVGQGDTLSLEFLEVGIRECGGCI